MKDSSTRFITIMGPTASGKTQVATHIAQLLGGVIISGDSRQVYRGMDIGTGKDLDDYTLDGQQIPYYLIDICDPGEKYNIFRFKQDFWDVVQQLPDSQPIIFCGGSGLYMESVLGGYHLPDVPENLELRKRLEQIDTSLLIEMLEAYGPLHNTTDITTKKRLIRAIEIAKYRKEHPDEDPIKHHDKIQGPIFVIDVDRETRRTRISERLENRINQGLIEEVRKLIAQGVKPEDLIYYGLEYKYVTEHVLGEYDLEEMKRRLEIAIHQFAKRQMTWIRGMERRGFRINYIKPKETPAQTALDILLFLHKQSQR